MGPQNGSKSDRHLYGGSGDYSPSERANAAVSNASSNTPVVGEKSGAAGPYSSAAKSQGGDMPKNQPVGGTTEKNLRWKNGVSHTDPSGSSINDNRA